MKWEGLTDNWVHFDSSQSKATTYNKWDKQRLNLLSPIFYLWSDYFTDFGCAAQPLSSGEHIQGSSAVTPWPFLCYHPVAKITTRTKHLIKCKGQISMNIPKDCSGSRRICPVWPLWPFLCFQPRAIFEILYTRLMWGLAAAIWGVEQSEIHCWLLLCTKAQQIRCLVFAANCHVNLCAYCAVCVRLIFSVCVSVTSSLMLFSVVALYIFPLLLGAERLEHLYVCQLHSHNLTTQWLLWLSCEVYI